MAVDHQFKQTPTASWLGLDLRSSALLKNPDASSYTRNSDVLRTGSLSMRRGYKAILSASGGCGAALYSRIGASNNSKTVEKLIIGEKLYKTSPGTFVITYGGAAFDSIYCSVLVDESDETWHFTLVADGTTLLDQDLGVGYDEVSPYTLANLKTAIELIADFTVVNTGSTSHPAAFLATAIYEPFTSNSVTLTYEYQSQVKQPSGSADPFDLTLAQINTDDFEFVTSANLNNVIYLASRYDELKKYDGQKIYRAGMKIAPSPTGAVFAAGSGKTATNIRYKIAFRQVDKQGNSIEGVISESGTAQLSPANDSVDVTFAAIQPTEGYNTDCATVNGVQAGVSTITVDSGHTIQIGDIIYFYNTATSAFVTRTVTATTATTIAFSASEGVVSVADYDAATSAGVISANLRVVLYAQQVADGDYYLVDEWPHNSTGATQVIRDSLTTWGERYLVPNPGTETSPPPKGQYVSAYKNILFLGGMLGSPDAVAYSDALNPEAFPASNNFNILTNIQDSISGFLATKEYLYIGKLGSSHLLTGDVDDVGLFRFRVDDLSLVTGCSTQRALCQIKDGSIVSLSQTGVYHEAGSGPQEVSARLLPAFISKAMDDEHELVHKRSVLLYDEFAQQVLVYIPTETDTSGNLWANSNSKLYVLDISRSSFGDGQIAWEAWDNMNMEGGAFLDERDLYWIERRYSSVSSAVTYVMFKRLDTDTVYDFVDHVTAIPWEVELGWTDAGLPSLFKKPIRVKMFSTDPIRSTPSSVTVIVERDFSPSYISNQFTLNFSSSGGGGWSVDPWDTSGWGAPGSLEREVRIRPVKCKALRYRLQHEEIYACPVVTAIETEWAIPFRMLMKE